MDKTLQINLWLGDCRSRLQQIESDSVDLVLTDPPYDLTSGSGKGGFMGKAWDATGIAFDPELWAEAFRVLKPGGWAKVFSATRTFHRVCVAMEAAGFEGVKDNLEAWTYGSGFPKSLNIGKALTKKGEADLAKLWEGYGTALKPAWEPIVCGRKPA